VGRDIVHTQPGNQIGEQIDAHRADDEPLAWPLDRPARARAVARATRPVLPEVHRAIAAQNATLAPSAARDAHIAALGRGAAAVVTGQQVGLFLGPLYTIYKAASAVALARSLAAETGAPVVPVFWLQTEDHDLPEIASYGVPGASACETIVAPIDADNRISIAHRTLPPEIEGCLARLEAALGEGNQAQAHVERLRRHYRAGVPWAAAFAGVLAELFAPEGLVMLDPRDPALAAIAAPIHARALDDAAPIAAAMVARCGELERAGSPVPVHVRPGAPLSFYHPDGALGPRVRLEPAGADAFAEVGSGRLHPRDALHAALRDDPRRFSTSALLRPILQDTLLPTVAYVGGPSEVAYFAQLGPVYRAFGRTPPLAVPRARFRITDARTRKLLARLGLSPRDVELPEAELLARLRARANPAVADVADVGDAPDAPDVGDAAEIARRLIDPFVAAHGALAATLGDAGPQIARALARTRASVERSIGKLAGKIERARLYADAERVDAIRRLRSLMAPDGAPQERRLGLAGLAARLGDRHVIERVLEAIDRSDHPFDGSLQELAA
jgi:bacillithiol biosynthesis cysteine-adding enzyme BshC